MLKRSETKNSLKTLKFRNRNLVLQFMRNSAAVSVNEISRATGLSKMTVHKIIDYYLEEGMISHAGKGVSTEEGGKKPNLFTFNADCRYIFAVRIAGDFLYTSIVNLKGEMLVKRRKVALVNAVFEQVIKMIGDAFADQVAEKGLPKENCLAAVVGCNGLVDVENGVCMAAYQYPDWGKNLPIRESLQMVLPDNVPVYVDSWWRHLAHGEVHFNGDWRRFFLLGNSGDYISGGMVLDGQAWQGATGFAGEIGHLVVAPYSNEKCVCGGVGCLEALVTPSRLVKRARQLRDEYPSSMVFVEREGDVDVTFAGMAKAADAGDTLARFLLDEVAGYFAIAVNNVIQICDPGRIVFFGDYAQSGSYFLEKLRTLVAHLNLHGVDKRTHIDVSDLGDEQGVVGAATHMTDKLFSGGQ